MGPECSQQDVYDKGAKFVVDDVLKGYNGTIFAYGQTSSGKTYTMEGVLKNKEKMGIIPRITKDIFKVTDKMKNVDLNIKVAYFEIYNEKVSDLFDKTRVNLAISEDKKGTPYVRVSTPYIFDISAGAPNATFLKNYDQIKTRTIQGGNLLGLRPEVYSTTTTIPF